MLEVGARDLHRVLNGPTLIHLPGRKDLPLFVSVLLHGNETSGLEAVQALLRRHLDEGLPRALSLFIGNVAAAREGLRRLDGQPDYNRIWLPGPLPEQRMLERVLDEMRGRGVFASVDIHNNTGTNPHYACVNRLDHRFFHLAVLFSRTVVYFTRPLGVQSDAFAALCPAVTVEVGHPGQPWGAAHAAEYLDACMRLTAFPEHAVAAHDMDLFHSVATVRIPDEVSFGFGEDDADLCLAADLDRMNFAELPADTFIGRVGGDGGARLLVCDAQGRELGERYFRCRDGEIRTRSSFVPSMFTVDKRAIRQDCLGYIMERYPRWTEEAVALTQTVRTG